MKKIHIGNSIISNDDKLTFILGPCQIESLSHTLFIAEHLANLRDKYSINIIYKSSFDKANRTSINGERGIGLAKSLPIFERVKKDFSLSVITDVHKESEIDELANVVDMLQIPAFLCRQTDLLIKAGESGLPINIKKGQFLSPYNMGSAIEKVASTGNDNILLTERGASFGYNNLVADMRSLVIMSRTGYPVIFDATHSVQMPSSLGDKTGGDRDMVPYLARSAVSLRIAGIFMEVHENPENAPSDGAVMLKLNDLEENIKILLDSS